MPPGYCSLCRANMNWWQNDAEEAKCSISRLSKFIVHKEEKVEARRIKMCYAGTAYTCPLEDYFKWVKYDFYFYFFCMKQIDSLLFCTTLLLTLISTLTSGHAAGFASYMWPNKCAVKYLQVLTFEVFSVILYRALMLSPVKCEVKEDWSKLPSAFIGLFIAGKCLNLWFTPVLLLQ